ncbi:MAG: DUF2288 domain-containing protein [Pseudomonadota bacterium]
MTTDVPMDADEALKTKLLGETALAPWSDLQRFFAQGVLLGVAAELDLIEVGLALARDDAERVRDWQTRQLLGPVTDEQARRWQDGAIDLWTTVIRPWVVVQERAATRREPPTDRA